MDYDEYEDRDLLDKAELHDATLLETGVLGKMVEDFLTGDIGSFVLNKIDEETQAAIQELIICDPTDHKSIQEHQNTIRVVNSIKNWLAEAIEAGILATNALSNK